MNFNTMPAKTGDHRHADLFRGTHITERNYKPSLLLTLLTALAAFLSLALLSCEEPKKPEQQAAASAKTQTPAYTTTLEIKHGDLFVSSRTLKVGKTARLSARFFPFDIPNKKFIWNSSYPGTVSVTQDGVITALWAGQSVITATADNGVKASVTVNTINTNAQIVPVTDIQLLNHVRAYIPSSPFTLRQNNLQRLYADVFPLNATINDVGWKSSDERVATVDSWGFLEAKSPGTAKITVVTQDGAKSAYVDITVLEALRSGSISYPVSEAKIKNTAGADVTSLALNENDRTQIFADIKPTYATIQNVSWKSSDRSVATIDGDGIVSALKAGNTTITLFVLDGASRISVVITLTVRAAGGGTQP